MKKFKKLNIIMYHYVRPIKNSKFPKIKGLEVSRFKKQLDYLSQNFNFITAEQLIAYSLGEDDLPNKSCYLTFDDGFKDHIDYVMPELLIRNIQGSFFPPTHAIEKKELLGAHAVHFILASSNNIDEVFIDLNNKSLDLGLTKSELEFFYKIYAVPINYADSFESAKTVYVKRMLQVVLPKKIRSIIISSLFDKYVAQNVNKFAQELYMSISDIKKLLNNGMYVGGHGCEHIFLGKSKKSEQIKEIDSCLNFLKKVGARTKNWIMCYPQGSYNKETLKILKAQNCLIGLTTKVGMADLDRSNLLELNRYDTNNFTQ